MKLVALDHRDVLCGRSTECQKHDGNQYLKSLIDRHLPKYAQAENKSDKSLILREIIGNIIMRGGRFLKKDCLSECYFVAGIKSARWVLKDYEMSNQVTWQVEINNASYVVTKWDTVFVKLWQLTNLNLCGDSIKWNMFWALARSPSATKPQSNLK